MGARYYCPWLARWLAPDPLNNEMYNMCKGVPQRSSERDFLEFTASGYEYCYANPVQFIDPTGEQAGSPSASKKDTTNKHTPEDPYAEKTMDAAKSYGTPEAAKAGVEAGAKQLEKRAEKIVQGNMATGRKVDNFGNVRQSPRQYVNAANRALAGHDTHIDLGGQNARGKFTTRLGGHMEHGANYLTPDALRLKDMAFKSLHFFEKSLAILSIYKIGVGKDSPVSFAVPVDILADPQAIQMEQMIFDKMTNQGLTEAKNFIEGVMGNSRNPFRDAIKDMRFIYLNSEQYQSFEKGELDFNSKDISSNQMYDSKYAILGIQTKEGFQTIHGYGL